MSSTQLFLLAFAMMLSYCRLNIILHTRYREVRVVCLLAGYAYIINPWLVLVAESLEMFTVHLAWMAAVLFTSSQSTPAIEASTQAVITVCHFGVGEAGGGRCYGLGRIGGHMQKEKWGV